MSSALCGCFSFFPGIHRIITQDDVEDYYE
jgi:environmental stress-induced protein Ves